MRNIIVRFLKTEMLIYNYTAKQNPIGIDKSKLKPEVQIQVKLLETVFAQRWKEYLLNLSKRVPHIGWYMTSQASNERNMTTAQMKEAIQKILDSFTFFHNNKIEDFADIITEIQGLMTNPKLVTQDHINRYHRWFTELSKRYTHTRKKFVGDLDDSTVYFHIQDINGYVHVLEQYTYYDLSRRRLFPICKQWSTQAHNAHNLNSLRNNIWDEMIWLEQGTFDFLTESYDHTVWLHEDILGKDQLKAWLDHDQLYPEDITGNLFMTPNVTFDPYKLYKTIMDREDFRQESKDSGKTLDKPPLGDIVNIDEVPWENMVFYEVKSIILDGQTLWEK